MATASGTPGKSKQDKPTFKLKIPAVSTPSASRPTRYKEKFQTLRDRYNEVTAINSDHIRSLEVAEDKIRRLQAENDLLLDALHSRSPQLLALVSPPTHYSEPGPPLPLPHHVVPSQSRRHRERDDLPPQLPPHPQPIPHRRSGGHGHHVEEHDQPFEWPRSHRHGRDSPPPPEARWGAGPPMDRTPDMHDMRGSGAHSPVEGMALPPPFYPPPTNGSHTGGRSGRRSRRSSIYDPMPLQNGHDRFIEENIPREG